MLIYIYSEILKKKPKKSQKNNKSWKLLTFTGIGSVHKRTGEVLAFIFNWSTVFILQPTAIAVLALTFSQYLLAGIMNGSLFYCQCNAILYVFLLDHDPSEVLVKIIAISTLCASTFNESSIHTFAF